MTRTMAQKAARKARQKQVEPPAAAAVPAEAGPSAAPGPKLSKKQRRKARLLEAKQAGALSAAEVEKAKQGAKKKKKSKGKNKRSAKTEYIHHDPPVRTSPPPKRAAAATAEVLIKDELASQVEANAEYQAVCSRPARLLDDPQRLLVVVDLNETLVLRTHNEWDLRRRRPVCAKPRPYLSTFLRWLGKIDCDLLIWSSAAQHNVRKLAVPLGYDPSSTEAWTNALPRLVGTWSRSDFGLSPREYAENVATRKDLAKVWAKVTQADGTRWSALNTVLLDNEADKAALQPLSHIALPSLSLETLDTDDALLGIIGVLDTLRHFDNVPSAIASGAIAFDARTAVDRGTQACVKAAVPIQSGPREFTYIDGHKMDQAGADERLRAWDAMEQLRLKGDAILNGKRS